MKLLNIDVNKRISEYLSALFKQSKDLTGVNRSLNTICGVVKFFNTQADLDKALYEFQSSSSMVKENDRAEYGDFQTPLTLSDAVCGHIKKSGFMPDVIIEPTSGKGNFILSAIKCFPTIKNILCVEIYDHYAYQSKFSLLDYFLVNKNYSQPPVIEIFHHNIFDFSFKTYSDQFKNLKVLILGNPPWVTNAMLGALNSTNLPDKSNFKNHIGFDAITGKGNFDIGEYIVLMLLKNFHKNNGYLSILLKNSVIKNIVYDQKQNQFCVSELEKYKIDAKKEFNASVEASLFHCRLNGKPEYECTEKDFYDSDVPSIHFGWTDDKFVSNTGYYQKNKRYDGKCPLIWRSGLKHDCSQILELKKDRDDYINKKGEKIKLENDLVFPFIKGSALKTNLIDDSEYYTIVTQTSVGQDTSYIKSKFPLTYKYLNRNEEYFNLRKSSIYENKPRFSIFGVGDYTFKPYKIAIAGLYKTLRFSLLLTKDKKPIIPDDTCYFLSFDNLQEAVITFILLNSPKTIEFIESIVFKDAKRVYSKDILMRIDLNRIADDHNFYGIQAECKALLPEYFSIITENHWLQYKADFQKKLQINNLNLFSLDVNA